MSPLSPPQADIERTSVCDAVYHFRSSRPFTRSILNRYGVSPYAGAGASARDASLHEPDRRLTTLRHSGAAAGLLALVVHRGHEAEAELSSLHHVALRREIVRE